MLMWHRSKKCVKVVPSVLAMEYHAYTLPAMIVVSQIQNHERFFSLCFLQGSRETEFKLKSITNKKQTHS